MTRITGSKLRLLPPSALIATSEVDHADWNYRPLLGRLQRRRFRLLLSLLADEPYGRLLEIGYGSGVLMPELARRCEGLFGVDPHDRHEEVGRVLARHGVTADLRSASVAELPFADGFFDAAVAVSSLEYVEELDRACGEIARVLAPGGHLVVVAPGESALLDLALRLTTGESAEENYGDRRGKLLRTLRRRFRVDREREFPDLPVLPKVYTALRLGAG